MTAPRKKHCPVCLRLVGRSMGDTIEGHWDTALEGCLGSGLPYRTCRSRKPSQSDPHQKAAA